LLIHWQNAPGSQERHGQVRTEQLIKRVRQWLILLLQEEVQLRSPIMIHGHLGVKAKHIATRTDTSRSVGELGEMFLKQRTHRFFIQTAAEFKPWKKWHGLVSCVVLSGSTWAPRGCISLYFHQKPG
jgi:hypothetical protein